MRSLKFFSTILLGSFFLFPTNAYASEPLPWQLGLQPPSGSIAVMANDLHNLLLIVQKRALIQKLVNLNHKN